MTIHSTAELVDKRYLLQGRLGAGGMGVVFRALDRLTQHDVALKQVAVPERVVQANTADQYTLRVALAREFQVLASLRHPQIINVLDYGFDAAQQPYFTMDLLEQPSTILEASRHQPLPEKARLLIQMLQALVYLHRRGVLHRDLKPGNVLVTESEVKVVDFGIAAQGPEPDQGVIGTVAYMAPELLAGQPPSQASDLYAVGVIAYEVFTGRHPFGAHLRDVSNLIYRVVSAPPDPAPLELVEQRYHAGETPPTLPTAAHVWEESTGASALSQQPPEETTWGGADETLDALPAPTREGGDGSPTLGNATRAGGPPPAAAEQTPSAAPSGEIPPLTAVVMRLLRKSPEARYQDAAEVIRDLSRAVGLSLAFETPALRESFLQAARFVGRRAPMIALEEALGQALAGRGGTWFVAGESGVGKSRLLDEIRTRALVAGALVVRGQASEAGIFYQVWREPVRRLALNVDLNDADASALKTIAPDIDELLDRPVPDAPAVEPHEAQQRLSAAVNSLFRRQTQPVVLVLEDLHWARAESIALLERLHALVEHLPLLILASYRADERVEALERFPGARVLKLERFTDAEIRELTASMIGAAAVQPRVTHLLERETEGNAFFLVEIVRALAEEAGELDRIAEMTLPQQVFTGGVRRIVQRRLQRIPASDFPLLSVAAVLGRELDLDVLRHAEPERDLDTWLYVAAEAAVLEVQDERWRFTHDKLREGIILELNEAARVSAHHRAAQALEAAHPDDPAYAAALAQQWGAAGQPGRELEHTLRAGEHAYQIGDGHGAIAHYERGRSLLETLRPNDWRARLVATDIQIGKAEMRLSLYPEATTQLGDALDRAQALERPPLAAEALCFLGRIALLKGDHAGAAAQLGESLALFRSLGDARGVAETLASLGHLDVFLGEPDTAAEHLEESLRTFRALGDARGTAHALAALGDLATRRGDLDEAARLLNESLALNRQIGNRASTAGVLMHLGMVALFQGDPAAARARLTESLDLFREVGERAGEAACLNNLGFIALESGEPADARRYFEQSLALSQVLGDEWGAANTLTNLGAVALALDEPEQASEQFRAALAQAMAIGAAPVALEALLGLAQLRADAGDAEGAVALAALAAHHPATNPNLQASADRLFQRLAATLPADRLETLIAAHRDRELAEVAAEALRD